MRDALSKYRRDINAITLGVNLAFLVAHKLPLWQNSSSRGTAFFDFPAVSFSSIIIGPCFGAAIHLFTFLKEPLGSLV